jgi:ABC-2 type transport system ATP-binding protein
VNAIDLRGVTKSYGRTHALAGVDLTFDRGVTGLLGPNGAGKTTLLRIVATSIAADAGTVQLLGRDPHHSHADVTAIRRELGYLPQELGYPSDMTAFGFVEYVAVLKEWNDRQRRTREVRRVLDLVGLGDLAAK